MLKIRRSQDLRNTYLYWDWALRAAVIFKTVLTMKSRSSIIFISVVQSFCYFPHSTAVMLPRFLKKDKLIRQPRNSGITAIKWQCHAPCVCSNTGPGPWFNIKMSSYQYWKSHCGDKTIVRWPDVFILNRRPSDATVVIYNACCTVANHLYFNQCTESFVG